MRECAACHGYQEGDRYVFEGEYLGKVEPNARLGVDPARLNSYTAEFQRYQVSELFKGTPYQFRHFRKTDGYANLPLDGLWLRAPYLHNGAVPTLADLLAPAGGTAQRPSFAASTCSTRRRAASRPRPAIRPSRRSGASASTPACPATAMAATPTARACRRPSRPISSPTS